MKLLLADDDGFLLDMYTVKFTEAGHDVTAVKDGEQALEILRRGEKFDGIVIDMIMPGLSGLDLLKTLQKEKLCDADCTYVVLSNQSGGTDMAAAKEAGASGYIVKAEAMPSEVVEKVIGMIGKK